MTLRPFLDIFPQNFLAGALTVWTLPTEGGGQTDVMEEVPPPLPLQRSQPL